MRNIIACLVLMVLAGQVSVIGSEAPLDAIGFEAGLSGGYSTNLLNDFTQIENYDPGAHLALRFYPTSKLEISGSYDRSWIMSQLEITDSDTLAPEQRDSLILLRDSLVQKLDGLSTTATGVHATYIPTEAHSRLSLYFKGGVGRRTYDGSDFHIYNTTDYDITAAAGYQLNRRLYLRGEVAYRYSDYTDAAYLDDMVNEKQGLDLVVGGNYSILGSNVIDLELGLTEQRFNETFVDTITVIDSISNPPQIYDSLSDGRADYKTRSFYISPRLSRQLGERTGVNVTLTYRSFVSGSDIVVAGEAANLLDPFATVWEGTGVTMSIKTFLIPRVIATLSLGYWDKTYLQHLEGYRVEGWGSTQYRPADRIDEQSSFYLGLQMPLPKKWAGLRIEPIFSAQYGDNSSTIETYDHFGWDLSLGVSLKR